jgi:hypothetical protein
LTRPNNRHRRWQVKNQQSKILKEGLRTLDLKELVYNTIEIDTFRSKMGEDRDVCVVSFVVKDRTPAKDLMEFIEKGFHQVLDADVSAGENNNGEYSVFVELSRTPKLAEDIKELLYGVRKLTGIENFKFKYYKNSNVHDVNENTLKSVVPLTPGDYDGLMTNIHTESVKQFFSKTLMDNLTLEGNIITIHKPFGQRVQLEMIKDDESNAILESITDTISVDEKSSGEMFWLTKVLGDYDIAKFGESFLFTNGNRSMLLKRI